MKTDIYKVIDEKIQIIFAGDSTGHDYWHTIRVYNNAMFIAKSEICDMEIVSLSALLHDVDDSKIFSTVNNRNARCIMENLHLSEAVINNVIHIINVISYKGIDSKKPDSIEGKIVQDADYLDAIGAIGIARAFAYGGSKGRCMHNPNILPILNIDEVSYGKYDSTTVNHYYEKLFLLKDKLNTNVAMQIAERRQKSMENFISEFLREWDETKLHGF